MVETIKPTNRTVTEKYNIIKYFCSLPPRGEKAATIKHFKISSISTLNEILKNQEKTWNHFIELGENDQVFNLNSIEENIYNI